MLKGGVQRGESTRTLFCFVFKHVYMNTRQTHAIHTYTKYILVQK